MTTQPLAEAARSGRDTYAAQIRAAVRGLWAGAIDIGQFSDSMFSAIRRYLTMAWHEGAAKCDVLPADLTPEEKMALETVIVAEFGYVAGFAADILGGNKVSGGEIAPFLTRVEQWGNRYTEVVGQAQMQACADEKFEWVRNRRKKSCDSCVRLDGKVKRASVWAAAGIHPKCDKLDCGGGRNCGCQQVKTNKPVTPGPLPRIG